jgi:transposase
VAKGGKRRRWSFDEKQTICAQTRVPGVSVAQVARRYNVNANQIFNWLKDPRFAADDEEAGTACFLPIEIARPDTHDDRRGVAAEGRIEIELVDGNRVIVNGSYDPEALGRLIRSLSG